MPVIEFSEQNKIEILKESAYKADFFDGKIKVSYRNK